VIVIDTLSGAAGFDDENSAAETQKVVNLLRDLSTTTGTLVAVIDHHGKMAAVANLTGQVALAKEGDDGIFRAFGRIG
jgi:ABC-type branched-subunit amino acid transport system ATPase component